MLKRTLLLLFAAIALLLGNACTTEPTNTALVIILGRHANAQEFTEEQYAHVKERIERSAYGGYVRLIIGGGKPILVPINQYVGEDEVDIEPKINGETVEARREVPTITGYYGANAYAGDEIQAIKSYNADEIMKFIKNPNNPNNVAKHSENDPLEAIRLAKATLNNINAEANRAGRPLKKMRILIMDTGVATMGDLDFQRFDLDDVNFKDTKNVEKKAEYIAEQLEKDLALKGLDLKDFDNNKYKEKDDFLRVRFVGLGDVADPQERLTHQQKEGLKTIWRAVLEKCNAGKEVRFFEGGGFGDKMQGDFPPVSTIEFGIPDEPRALDVHFEYAKDTYIDREKTKTRLGVYANSFKRKLSADPSLKLYIVGAESRDGYRSRDLSNRRAYAVKNSLASLGVSPDRIIAFGVGIDDPWRDDEGPDANGRFNEKIAEKNRKVMFFYSSDAEKVKDAEEARDKK